MKKLLGKKQEKRRVRRSQKRKGEGWPVPHSWNARAGKVYKKNKILLKGAAGSA